MRHDRIGAGLRGGQGPGWRWIFFVNPPLSVLVIAGAFWLLGRDPGRDRSAGFDIQGAVLVTAGVLLLVYALVRAPQVGWGSTRTIGELAGAGTLLAVFVVNEALTRHPLVPLSILRVRGLAAADLTQLLAFAGIFAMLFFITLYLQEILHYSPLRAGIGYLPITAGFAVAGAIASRLITRVGSRPVIVAGALIGGAGVYWLARVPVNGSYAADVLPGMLVMALGMGAVFVAATAAASEGVPPGQAGLAAGMINASQQLGSALGLAVLSAIATSRTTSLIHLHVALPTALTSGYHRGLLGGSIFMAAAAVIGLRISNTRAAAPVVIAPEVEPDPGHSFPAGRGAGHDATRHESVAR